MSAPEPSNRSAGTDAREIARAWAALLAVAKWRQPDYPDADTSFGLAEASGALCVVSDDSPDALVCWQRRRGFAVAPNASPAAAAMLELYLPVCNASARSPLVVGHLGQSFDGFIATRTGDSDYVTGPENILHLHRMRALCDAVLVGAETVAADDPSLTARHAGGRNPVRVIVDPTRRLAEELGVFSDGAARTLIVCEAAYADRGHAADVEIVGVPATSTGLDLAALLDVLHARSLHAVFVEGGGKTVSAFLEHGLLDRLQIAVAPLVIGDGRPGLCLPEQQRLEDCMRFEPRYFTMGQDVLFDCDLHASEPPALRRRLQHIAPSAPASGSAAARADRRDRR